METLYLIWRLGNGDTKLQAVIDFTEDSYHEFENAENKRYWLQEKLGLKEEYFWNTYLEVPEVYIAEKDEYTLDKEYQEADKFTVR